MRDLGQAEDAVRDLLSALGVDVNDEHIQGTPRRVAVALAEFLTPEPFVATTFSNDGQYDELILVRSIRFSSLCAHHLLPFVGVAHVGYLPGDRIVGLSKLARMVNYFASDLQLQERLTMQIAHWLQDAVGARGAGVVISAEHMCMSLRGARAHDAVTVTSCLSGLVRTDPKTRAEFLALAREPTLGRPTQ
ncbi:MAG TPA: GTP cyclohydrolase I FolE [Mycobacterium sp.]|nr:GTP cyclohydrolase I FolE [Mycobacterium sp.]